MSVLVTFLITYMQDIILYPPRMQAEQILNAAPLGPDQVQ